METKYKLSFFDTISMATGFAIGSGIITLTGMGIGMTGRSICLAFPVCAILFLISFRPIFIMSNVYPTMSAAYEYSSYLLGKKIGGLYAYMYLFGRFTISIFGLSFAEYASSLVPFFNTPIRQRIVACVLLTVFYVVNLLGVKCAAKLQNVLFFVLLFGLISFVVFGLPKVDPAYFEKDFFVGGFEGFYSAVSLLFFAVTGAYIITDFAPKIENPSKVVVKVILIVTGFVTVLYTFIGVIASGCADLAEVAWKPLSVTAKLIYPNNVLFAFFIIGGAMGALVTTLNSSFVWYSSSLERACNDGWLPKKWAETNKHGAPYRLMTLFYLFGLVPTVLGIDLVIISKVAVGMTILSSLIPMVGVINLPEKFPKEWAESKYAGKYNKKSLVVMVIITYLIMSTQVVSLFVDNPPVANIIIIVYILAVCVYLFLIKKK